MTKGNIQYFADTLLLEKLAIMEYGLTKEAGLAEALEGMASSIIGNIKEEVKEKGMATVLEEHLVSGIILKMLGPWGYAIEFGAKALGFDINSYIDSLINFVKSAISSGKQLTFDEVNQAGKSLSGVTASNDMFMFLRKAEAEGNIMKYAGIGDYLSIANKANPFFGGKGGILSRIFGNLFNMRSGGKSKILMIIVGLIVWAIKTILLGAGVAGASSAIGNYIHKDAPAETKSQDNTTENASFQTENSVHPVKVNLPPTIPNSFSSSGDGNQYHINDGSSVWVVPLVNQSVEKTLTYWANSIYPELKGHESELNQLSSFNNMASALKAGLEENHPDYLTIPQGLHSRKDIVDRFVGALNLKDYK